MNKKVLVLFGLLILILVGLSFWRYDWYDKLQINRRSNETTRISLSTIKDRQIISLVVDEQVLEVEAVTTPASLTQGLSGREEIGSDGMLFIFPSTQQVSFWMKDMQFDLDLIWILNDEVIGVTARVPAPSPQPTPPSNTTTNTTIPPLPTYSSPGAVNMVLEVPAGYAEENSIIKGTRVMELKPSTTL